VDPPRAALCPPSTSRAPGGPSGTHKMRRINGFTGKRPEGFRATLVQTLAASSSERPPVGQGRKSLRPERGVRIIGGALPPQNQVPTISKGFKTGGGCDLQQYCPTVQTTDSEGNQKPDERSQT
jgi:hypothetical protein